MADPAPLPYKPASRASKIAAAVLVLFLAAGLLSNAWLVFTTKTDLLPTAVTRSSILDGSTSSALAARMADAPLPSEAARLQRGLGWLVLGDLGPRVRQGCPGWLFIEDELAVYPDAQLHAQTRANTVMQVQRELAQRGIKLLVIVVPDKSRIETQRLCSLYVPPIFAQRVTNWVSSLTRQGVPVLDLTQTLQSVKGDAFYRTDTHWNEAGAEAAAQATAQHARLLGVTLPAGPSFTVQALAPAPRPGDLVHLAGLDWLPLALQPKDEVVQEHNFVEQAKPATSADDLFGNDDLPQVALLGTSYSRRSNFEPQLEQALGAAVGDFARDGGKFGGSANAYFTSKAFTQTPPKLVVWEVDERDLQSALDKTDTVNVPNH